MKPRKKARTDCPFCTPKKQRCPFCDLPIDPFREARCTLNKPLLMVIPPEGVHLDCPIHPEGHHIFGPRISFMKPSDPACLNRPIIEYDSSQRPIEYDSTQNQIVEFDSTRPWRPTGDKMKFTC